MADSKQLRILKALTTLLQGITPTNGYDYDLSSAVYRGKLTFGSDEPVPFLVIVEAIKPDIHPQDGGTEMLNRIEDWPLLIQGFATISRQFPTDDLYNLKAATEKRLSAIVANNDMGVPAFPDLYRLGRLISSIRIGPGVVRAALPGSGGTEAFYLPLSVGYAIDLTDPWAN